MKILFMDRFTSKGNFISNNLQNNHSLKSSEHRAIVQRLKTHSCVLEHSQAPGDSPEMCVPRLPPPHQTPSVAGAGVWCHCPRWPCPHYTKTRRGKHWARLQISSIVIPFPSLCLSLTTSCSCISSVVTESFYLQSSGVRGHPCHCFPSIDELSEAQERNGATALSS